MILKLNNKFSFVGEVWRWPGYAGWHFVSLPKSLAKKIKIIAKTYGAGFIKVEVTLGKSVWQTALFPHKDSGTYLVSIKKSIRKSEGVWERDRVKIILKV